MKDHTPSENNKYLELHEKWELLAEENKKLKEHITRAVECAFSVRKLVNKMGKIGIKEFTINQVREIVCHMESEIILWEDKDDE